MKNKKITLAFIALLNVFFFQLCVPFDFTAQDEAEQRIERYMVTAGQAVSYKVGELKIIELRERAKKKLGNKFDIKEFHDKVLKDGCLPQIILETKINKWIESKVAKN